MANTNLPDDIPVLTEPAAQRLNQRQQLDYRNHRETLLQWLLHLGKDPRNATGYSTSTVKRDAYRIDQFYRWVWEQEDGYTTAVTQKQRVCKNLIDYIRASDANPEVEDEKPRAIDTERKYDSANTLRNFFIDSEQTISKPCLYHARGFLKYISGHPATLRIKTGC